MNRRADEEKDPMAPSDQTLNQSKPGEEDIRSNGTFMTGKVTTVAAAHAVHDTFTGFLPPLLPRFIQIFSLTKTEAGLLSIIFQAPSITQPFIGHLADRLSLRYLVILAPAISAIAMSMIGVAPSYGMLAMLLAVAGLSSAAFHAVAPVMAGRLSGDNLGKGMGFWMVGGELGRSLGPLVIVTAFSLLEPGQTPWLMLAGLLASAILYVRLKDIPGRVSQEGPGISKDILLSRIRPIVLPLAGIILLRALLVSALSTYMPTFLNEQGATLWLAGAALTLFEGAGVAGALLGGSISDRLGRRVVLSVSFLSTSVLLILFLLVNGWGQIPLLLALGFSSLSVTPVVMAIVQESFPENRAFANGVYMLLNFSLRSIGVLAIGIIGDALGLTIAYAVSAGVILLALPLVYLLPDNRPTASQAPGE